MTAANTTKWLSGLLLLSCSHRIHSLSEQCVSPANSSGTVGDVCRWLRAPLSRSIDHAETEFPCSFAV